MLLGIGRVRSTAIYRPVDQSVFNQQNAISRLRESFVMRNHHKGDATFLIHLAHQMKNFLTGAAIEIPCRFISEHDFRIVGECADNGAPLILSAAHLIRAFAHGVVRCQSVPRA